MIISDKTKRWSAIAAGVLALSGGGVGMALAGSGPAGPPPARTGTARSR